MNTSFIKKSKLAIIICMGNLEESKYHPDKNPITGPGILPTHRLIHKEEVGAGHLDKNSLEPYLVQERARQVADLKVAKIKEKLNDLRITYKERGERGYKEISTLWRVLTEHHFDSLIFEEDYQKAYEYVENLQKSHPFNPAKAILSSIKLLILEWQRQKRQKTDESEHILN